jgi:hypothetical protein
VRVTQCRDLDIQIAPETGFDRFGKRWGLSTEVQLGDQLLDRALYLRGSFDYQLTRALQADGAKLAMRQLLEQGFSQIDITARERQLSCQLSPFAATIMQAMPRLQIAAHALRALDRALPLKGPKYGTGIAAIGLAIALTLFGAMIFFIGSYKPVDGRDLLLLTLATSAVLYPAFVWLSGVCLRGRSRSHDTWAVFAVCAAVAVPLGSYGGFVLLNAKLDQSVGQTRAVLIVDKKQSRRKNRSQYTICFNDPRGNGETHSMQVDFSEYESVTPGRSQMQGKLHEGFLGVPWWSELRIVFRPTALSAERP